MPETYDSALSRAEREGFDKSSLQKGKLGWYIVPHGITSAKARRAYVHARDAGNSPSISASIAWHVQKINKIKKG